MADKKDIVGWGLYPKARGYEKTISSTQELSGLLAQQVCIRGNGRSYGDSAIDTLCIKPRGFSKITSFDDTKGVISCGSGTLLSEILEFIVPKGYFLPVTPGTKFVSLGGALAADVHGKNHHVDGNISSYVESFELITEDGVTHKCSASENDELFWASMGGMGLTGLITSIQLKCIPIESAYISLKSIKTKSLDDTIDEIIKNKNAKYSVAWIDCVTKGTKMGRSLLTIGDHAPISSLSEKQKKNALLVHPNKQKNVPFYFPSFLMNRFTVKLFNTLRYHRQSKRELEKISHYNPFFYPLDALANWNRVYGKKGFIQYQFVLPTDKSKEGMHIILKRIADSGMASALAVLKMFGPERNNNYIAFPKEGLNLALDIKLTNKTLKLLDELDELVLNYGGRTYLAKDSRQNLKMMVDAYPEFDKFKTLIKKYNPNMRFSSHQAKRLKITPDNTPDENTVKHLTMKNVLILGANSDIAKACAKEFIGNGFSATLASRNTEVLSEFAHSLDNKNITVKPFDACDFNSHEGFYQNLEVKPNVVICAFGYLPDNDKAKTNWEEALKSIQTNYTGAVSILNIIANDFKNRGEGCILGISSVAGDRGRASNYLYGAPKAAFTAYLSGLRNDLIKTGVHVSTIKPGFVKTKMIDGLETPGPLTAKAADVAKVCYKAYRKRRSVVYVKSVWRPVMWIIKHLPEFMFKKSSI